MDNDQEEKMVRTSVTIPKSVMEKFKAHCKGKRRSVSAQITLLMEQELKHENKSKKDDESKKN